MSATAHTCSMTRHELGKSTCAAVVNPLAETPEGTLLAADAKLGFDENAAYRQKEIFDLRDESQMDP
eukprot:scaffold46532_cov17-Tisochrysis_lutea.AAC.1